MEASKLNLIESTIPPKHSHCPMPELKSAEATTKYLRSKDIKPKEAVQTAEALLDGSLDVFLINKHHFVFDLICDRVSDFTGKDFKSWKFEPLLWLLWGRIWNRMEKLPLDLEVRTRSFKRVKLVSAMTAVLTEASDDKLLEAMFSCVASILASGYVEVDEYTVTGLLAEYSRWLDKTQSLTPVADEWTRVVLQLFELPRKSINYKPTKKSTARYFSSALPHLLNFLSREDNEEAKESQEILAALNKIFMFQVETTRALISHMEDVLAYEGLSDSAVRYLFQQVIINSAASDIASCEAVFLGITKLDRFSHLSESLLQILSSVNKALSSDFFQNLYDNEIASKPVKWGLIGEIAYLSPELAQAKAEDIVKATKDLKAEEVEVVALGLARGFIRARDFNEFVAKIFPMALEVSSSWSNEQIVDSLAAKCTELSSSQISSLLEVSIKEKHEEVIVLLLRGLLMCSESKQEAAGKVLNKHKETLSTNSEIAYYALCIYEDDLITDDFLKSVESRTQVTKFDIYLALRVAELTGDLKYVKEKDLKKFLRKAPGDVAQSFFRRWLVITDSFDSINISLVLRLLDTTTKEDFLALFEDEAVLVYELPGFLASLLAFITKQKEFPYLKELLCMLPVTIYRKFFSGFTDKLCKDALTSKDSKEVLRHVLEDANGSSELEKDCKLFLKFVASDDSALTIEVGKLIWNGHINRLKDEVSRDFVNKVIEKVTKSLSKKLSSLDLRICQIILNGNPPKDEELQNAIGEVCALYVKAVTELPKISETEIAVLSDLPGQFTDNALNLLKGYIKSLENKKVSSTDKRSLFVLITKMTKPNLHGALFISSLFLALFEELDLSSNLGVIERLSAFFKKLPHEDFHQIYLHLLASCEEAPSNYLDPLVRILTVLAHLLDKSSQKDHTALFVGTISAISLRIGDIQRVETLLNFTSTVTSMLSDHAWLFSQYAIELTLATVGRILTQSKHSHQPKVYISIVSLLSYVILFHRFRLTSRYHLLIGILVETMRKLSSKEATEDAAAVFGRVLVTLSEPPIQRSTKESDSLTSQSAIYKRAIRKQAHVLLINYVHMQVSTPLKSSLTDALMPGIYSVFSLLSKVELQLANQLLDLLGRVYFKSLYQSYKDHGKWKN